jgi:hypothetical protein
MLYKCNECNYLSENKANVKRHMSNKHSVNINNNINIDKNNDNIDTNIPQKDIKCTQCYKVFQKSWILNRHLLTCNGKTHPCECIKCHKIYSSKSSLSQHRKICIVEKITTTEFKCDQCYKSFDKNWLLTRHKLSCTGKLHPNECINCHRILPSCSALSHHKKKCVNVSEVKQELINTVPPVKEAPPVEEPIIQPVVVENKKYKKVTIPQSLRAAVWDKYIGRKIGEIECLVCNAALISQLNFHCGHVVAEANGGTISIDNLRPICKSCNCSMGTNNLEDYKNRYFKCENAYKEENIISNEYRNEVI